MVAVTMTFFTRAGMLIGLETKTNQEATPISLQGRRRKMSLSPGWVDFLEPDFLGNVIEFFARDGFELFAAGFELFVDLDDFFSHRLMRFFRTADEGKVLARGDAFMAVRIEADSEHDSLALLLRIRH